MRIKPTHLKKCAEALDGDHLDALSAARAVIEEIDRLRAEDITYIAVRQYDSPISGAQYMGYGPFPTKAAAQKAAEHGTVGIPGFGLLAIVPMRSHSSQLAKLKSLDELDPHLAGHHWTRIKEKVSG